MRQNGIAYPYNGWHFASTVAPNESRIRVNNGTNGNGQFFHELQSSVGLVIFCLFSLSTIVFVVANLSLAYAFCRRLTRASTSGCTCVRCMHCVCATEQAHPTQSAEDEISFALSRSTAPRCTQFCRRRCWFWFCFDKARIAIANQQRSKPFARFLSFNR